MTLRSVLRGVVPLLLVQAGAAWAISVTLNPSNPAALPVGERQTYTATARDTGGDEVWYRFRVRPEGGEFRLVRDFAPGASFEWATLDGEGWYEVEVTARTSTNPAEAVDVVSQELVARVEPGGAAAVNPTPNALVWIFSAPPCEPGFIAYVEFTREGGLPQLSSPRVCDGAHSVNFYLAGLLQDATYSARLMVSVEGLPVASEPVGFHTGTVDEGELGIPARRLLAGPASPAYEGVVLNSPIGAPFYATDLSGNLIWYYPRPMGFITRPNLGGTFVSITWTNNPIRTEQVAREFDVAGITLWETNAAIISERLQALGYPATSGFHHEAFRLPDGRMLLLAGVEKRVPELDNKNVMGDMIIVVDNEMNIHWVWNSFDHMDVRKEAILGEMCLNNGACPPVFDGGAATDWLHTNSVQYTSDGNLLLSMRHLDWAVKVDYQDGFGSGAVLWRLGKDGDFQIDSTEAFPWFSHQHDAGFLPGSDRYLLVFDNGNTHRDVNPQANSRGQLYELDQEARTAKLAMNADLGGYSFALGSAQRLRSEHYHFNNGWTLVGGQPASTAVEVDPSGRIVYALESGAAVYRSFRMEDILTP